jgi:recombination protein RecA
MAKKSDKTDAQKVTPGASGTNPKPTPKPVPNGRVASLLASDLVKKLRKTNGETTLLRASDNKILDTERLPTGIFDLDYALGGGFPVGKISTLYGPKSAGKTTVFLKAIAIAQRTCSNCYTMWDPEAGNCACGDFREHVCAFLDVEGTLDTAWARTLGVNTDSLIVDVPEYAEQALDIGEALLRSGDVDVLCLDSLAFLVPRKEIEHSVAKDMMGVQPRLIGSGIRKFVSAINGVGRDTGRRPTVFFTNQIRFKLGMLFGNPETTPGGQGPGFASAVEVRVQGMKYELHDVTKKPMWVDMKFRIMKNKTFGARMEGEYRMMLSSTPTKAVGDTCDEPSLISWGEKVGLITRDKGYNCLGRNFRIKADMVESLEADHQFQQELRDHLLPILIHL